MKRQIFPCQSEESTLGLFLKEIKLPGKLPTFDAVEAPLPKRVILPLRQYIGGPAGLTCAYYPAQFGHSATVLEAMLKLAGMLRYQYNIWITFVAPNTKVIERCLRCGLICYRKQG